MGVRGLWKVVEPTAKPVLLENMRGKVLAIDASIWIYHFIKAMRDGKGELLRGAHLVGFFRRICKLLFYEIKPVFVFDGAAPILKKSTTKRRQQRRQDREETARATANRILTLQLQRLAQDPNSDQVQIKGSVPKDAHFLGQESHAPHGAPKQFQSLDAYHLPEIESIAPVQINDSRLLTEEELNDYAARFTAEARAGFIDSATVDFKSPEFAHLPLATQYQLVNTARLKSRLRMGYSAEQLDAMFPNSMDFSRFQIQRVAQRNFLTQRLMGLAGLEEDLTRRVSSEKDKHYMLKRNDEGWTLSLENESSNSLEHRDLPKKQPRVKSEESDSDDFEEVDIEPEANGIESPQANAQIESPQPSPSVEAEPDLEALFGFEASVQREKLFQPAQPERQASTSSSFLFTKASKEDKTQRSLHKSYPAAPLEESSSSSKTGAVSFLFSKNISSSKDDSPASKKEEAVSPEIPSEASVTTTPAQEVPPWFNQSENTFEPMTITDRTEGNLVPIEMIDRLRGDYEQPAKKLKSEQVLSHKDKSTTAPETNPTSHTQTKQTLDHPSVTSAESIAAKPTAAQPAAAKELAVEQSEAKPVTSQTTAKPAVVETTVPTPIATGATPPKKIAEESLPAVEHRDADPVPGEAHGRVLTEEEIMLAEADALAQDDEDQELADMMIGEVEEAERFNKTLNILTDGAAYRSEIQSLKEQFANQKRDADTVTEEMITECQELLQLFGIPYMTAPMEAEAQCAELQHLNLVDGVVTDDGDAFLFGDVVVYRNMFSMAKYVECYRSRDIADQLGLDREKLICLAFLLGSDYTDGVVGIGPVTGVELLAEFGSLDSFKKWWNHTQRNPSEENLSSTFKRQFYKRFKSKLFLSETFPEEAVTDAYLHPVVDPDDTKFEWAPLDLNGLQNFLARYAGWDPEHTSEMLIPIVEETKRRELIHKGKQDQSNLDKWIVENKHLRSKRAHKATNQLRKRQ